MTHEGLPILGRFFNANSGPQPGDITVVGDQTYASGFSINGKDAQLVDRKILQDKWRKSQSKITVYGEGEYPDGTPYGGGRILLIDNEQVMDDFETPWVDATVRHMFQGKNGPQNVVERGFGLGKIADRIYDRLRAEGGTHTIVELNEGNFKYAQKWADQKRAELRSRFPGAPNVEINVINGDADEELAKMPDGSISLLFSDTHQLRPEELGINDLLQPNLLVTKLKPDGRFTFCAFHRENQTPNLDSRQAAIIDPLFAKYDIIRVVLTPPPHSVYLKGPHVTVPAIVAYRSDPLAIAS